MKGVMNKLSTTFGKKPRETKKTPAEVKTRPSTFPVTSRIYTGTSIRPNFPLSSRKDSQIPKPGTSSTLAKETSTQVSKEGAGYSRRLHENKTTKTSRTDDSKLYRDSEEDKIHDNKTIKTLQTKDSKLYRDAVEDGIHKDKTGTQLQTKDSKLYRDSVEDGIHKDKTEKKLQTKDSKLYGDFVEDILIKETRPPPNTPQKLRHPRIDSDNRTDVGKKHRDEEQADDDDFTNKNVSGLSDDTGEYRTSNKNQSGDPQAHNDSDKDEKYGVTLVKALQFFQDESDDDIDGGKSSDCGPVERHDDFPIEKDKNETEDSQASASPFIEFPDSDKDISLDIKRNIVYLLPKSDPPSPEDPHVTGSHFKTDTDRSIKSDDYLSERYDRISHNPEQVLSGYSEGVYLRDISKEDKNNFSTQQEKSTLECDQDPVNYIHKNNNKKSSSDILEDVDPCRPINNHTTSKYNYPSASRSGNHLEGGEMFRRDYEDLFMYTDGLDGYREGAYCIYGSNEDIGNICAQHEPSTSTYDQHPIRNEYDDDTFHPDYKKHVNPFRLTNDQALRKYYYESASGHHFEREKMVRQNPEEFFVEHEGNPDRVSGDNSAERALVINQRSKEETGRINPKQHLPNHSQDLASSFNKDIDSNKDDGRMFKDDEKRLPMKSDTNVPEGHKAQSDNLQTSMDTAANLSQSSEGSSNRQLSLFGRWMVTHGQLVDPHNFCLWSYATYPDLYIDLSKYQMDLQGRWLDTKGRYITPFFYCYSYDGEAVYLGDCDYYDVFNNSYDIDTDYSNEFVNNPERYIDLSSFQMDMEERWMDCGEYIDPITDWYDIDSEEDEYYEYGSLCINPEAHDLSGLLDATDGYYQDFSHEDNLYLSKANELVSDRYYTDYPSAGDYIFWDYPAGYGDSTDVAASMQNLYLGSGYFCDDFKGTNKEDFDDKDEPCSYHSGQYLPKNKTK